MKSACGLRACAAIGFVAVAMASAGCGRALPQPAGADVAKVTPSTAKPVAGQTKAPPATAAPAAILPVTGDAAPGLGGGEPAAAAKRYWHWRLQTGGSAAISGERWIGVASDAPTFFVGGGVVHQADPADQGAHSFMVEGRALSYSAISQLPTDTAGMSAFLWAPYHTTAFTPRLFDEMIDLSLAPTPPAALAAAYRAITQRTEVHYAGRTIDPGGRAALAFVFELDAQQNQLFVDPETGAALARRAVGAGGGTLTIGTTVLLREWTDVTPMPGEAATS